MNPKIQRVIAEIDRSKAKITELQARVKELEAQRIDMENTEIVALFRSVDVAPKKLTEFIRAYKAGVPQAPTTTYAPSVTTNEEDIIDEE